MTDGRMPYATRPLRNGYIALGKLLEDDSYLDMTERQFVLRGLQLEGGTIHPQWMKDRYEELMVDAEMSNLK